MIQTHCISKRFNLAQNPPLAPETVYDKSMKNEIQLTAEELDLLARSTPTDWAETVTEVTKDPNFWGDVAKAFLEGFLGSR